MNGSDSAPSRAILQTHQRDQAIDYLIAYGVWTESEAVGRTFESITDQNVLDLMLKMNEKSNLTLKEKRLRIAEEMRLGSGVSLSADAETVRNKVAESISRARLLAEQVNMIDNLLREAKDHEKVEFFERCASRDRPGIVAVLTENFTDFEKQHTIKSFQDVATYIRDLQPQFRVALRVQNTVQQQQQSNTINHNNKRNRHGANNSSSSTSANTQIVKKDPNHTNNDQKHKMLKVDMSKLNPQQQSWKDQHRCLNCGQDHMYWVCTQPKSDLPLLDNSGNDKKVKHTNTDRLKSKDNFKRVKNSVNESKNSAIGGEATHS